MVANIILFLGVADDSKVVAKLKCNIWFQLHTKQMDVSLSDRSSCEVKYFVRYLCHIPIVIFQDFFPDFKITLCTLLQVDKFWTGSSDSEKQKDRIRAEEAHHAITQIGYAKAYPSAFGLSSQSTLLKECKKATCDWWTHPENKCLKKKPLLKNVRNCMKSFASYPGEVYPDNGGSKCTASQNEETCKEASCNCMEWYHQVS